MIIFSSFVTALSLFAAPAQSDWAASFLEGNRALESGDLERAGAALDEALLQVPNHPPTAWAQACLAAREGDKDRAFEWLNRCVEWGGGESALLKWDPDLASLRDDQRYEELMVLFTQSEAHRVSDDPLNARICSSDFLGGECRTVNTNPMIFGDQLLDLTTNEVVTTLGWDGEKYDEFTTSKDGRFFATVTTYTSRTEDEKQQLRVFDLERSEVVAELEVKGHCKIEFSEDASRISVLERPGRELCVLELFGDQRVHVLPLDKPVTEEHYQDCLSRPTFVTTEGDRVWYSQRNTMFAWDLKGGVKSIGELTANSAISKSIDAELLVVRRNGTGLGVVYDISTESELFAIEHCEKGVIFADGKEELVALGKDGRVRVFNARTGKELRSFDLPFEAFYYFKALPNDLVVFTDRESGVVYIVNTVSQEIVWSYGETEREDAFGARNLRAGEELLITDRNGYRHLFEAKNGTKIRSFAPERLRLVAQAHPHLPDVWLGTSGGTLRRVDIVTGQSLEAWQLGEAMILAIEFSPDASKVAVLDSRSNVRILDSRSGLVEAVLKGNGTKLKGWFSPDAGWRGPHLDFSNDGSKLLYAEELDERFSGLAAHVYDTTTWTKLFTKKLPFGYSRTWDWRPGGSELAIAQSGGVVELLDSTTGESKEEEFHVSGDVETLAFEPSGSALWVTNQDNDVTIFDVMNGDIENVFNLNRYGDWGQFKGVQLTFRKSDGLAIATSGGVAVVVAFAPQTRALLWRWTNGWEGMPAVLRSQFGDSGNMLYVWGQRNERNARVIDVLDGESEMLDKGLESLIPIAGEEYVGALGNRGLEMFTLGAERKRLWSRIELPNDGWLLRSLSGHVDGSLDAIRSLQLELPDRSASLDALATVILDPKRFRAGAAGVELRPVQRPAIPKLFWRTRMPRVVNLAAEDSTLKLFLDASCDGDLKGFEVRIDGQVEFRTGERSESLKRTLELSLERPAPGTSTEIRVRAITIADIYSPARYLTVTAED